MISTWTNKFDQGSKNETVKQAACKLVSLHTLGLNKPGSQTELGVVMLPAVQLFSWSYLFRMSCTTKQAMKHS